jgi:O-antigen/teichoic acid export membrane protein
MSAWRLASLISSLIGARMAGAVFGLLIQLVLARTFMPADVGLVLLAMSLTAFVSLVITAGYPALGVTYLARYQTLGRRNLVLAFFAAARRDMAVLSLIVFGGIAAAEAFLPLPESMREAFLYGAIAALPLALIRLNNVAANSLRRFTLSYFPDFVLRPGLLLVFIAILALVWGGLSIRYVLWGFVAITTAVAIGQSWMLGRDGALAGLRRRNARDIAHFYRYRAAALVLVALVTIAYADIVTLITGLVLPPEEVAILGMAIRIAALGGFVSLSLQHFVIRDLTTALARGTPAEVQALLARTNVAGTSLMIVAIAGAAVLGGPVLSVFGPEYAAGKWALVMFLVSQAMRAASGMNAHLLSLDGHQARTASMCLASIVVLVSAAAVLAPRFGIEGVAAAAIAADLFWAVSLGVLARRFSRVPGDLMGTISFKLRSMLPQASAPARPE